jgi:hypothetical protein
MPAEKRYSELSMPKDDAAEDAETSCAPKYSPFGLLFPIVAIVLFLQLRAFYWARTDEVLFSDMADYFRIAGQVADHWDFRHSPFWASYKPPTLPFLAGIFFFCRGEQSVEAWRWFETLCHVSALIWLSYELACVSKRRWLGWTLLLVVALSKSSIFWSFKFSTEGLAEMFTYLAAAVSLRCYRRPTRVWSFCLGVVSIAAVLNRPQTVPLLILLPLLMLLPRAPSATAAPEPVTSAIGCRSRLALYSCAVFLVWSPWLIRGFRLYGHLLPFSTQGAYSFLWDFRATDEGLPNVRLASLLRENAESRFANDYEAQRYAQSFVKRWFERHWSEYPRITWRRILFSVKGRKVSLTHVSRESLFDNRLDALLFDKTPAAVAGGILGMLLFSFFIPAAGLTLFVVSVTPWLMGTLFLSLPRLLEPSLPLILFGNVLLVVSICCMLQKYGPRILSGRK